MYYVGLDLGQRSDYTALAVLEAPVAYQLGAPPKPWHTTNPARRPRGMWVSPETVPLDVWGSVLWARQADRQTYAVRHLHRFDLGTPYPVIVEAVQRLLTQEPLHWRSRLLVDATGVGRPVVDALRAARLDPIAITMTGGDTVNRLSSVEWRVPKRDLATVVQVLLQEKRLQFAGSLPLLATLTQELQAFEVKIDAKTAHDSYLAWRDGAHDDLVLAVAMACWAVESDAVPQPWIRETMQPLSFYAV